MLRWLKGLLFESTPAEFRSDYAVDESVQRLSAVTSRWGLSLGETRAVGKVSPDKVRLQRVIPMVRNSFSPFFVGRFETRNGRTVLTGHFAMSVSTRIFMTIWLAMATLFAIAFLAGDVRSTDPAAPSFFLVPLLMPTAGVGFVILAKWFARNDAAWLSDVMTRALSASSDRAPQEPKAEPASTPIVLKGVALFLAASSAIAGVMSLSAPRVPPLRPPFRLHAVYAVYAVLELVLAFGVWYRRPWAWWGGFAALAAAIIVSLAALPTISQSPPQPMFQVAFGVAMLIVAGSWGAWWYAQRELFRWEDDAGSPSGGTPNQS